MPEMKCFKSRRLWPGENQMEDLSNLVLEHKLGPSAPVRGLSRLPPPSAGEGGGRALPPRKRDRACPRTGATWYRNEKGRLVEIPVDFDLEPVDIVTALTVGHLKRIEELEARLEEVEED